MNKLSGTAACRNGLVNKIKLHKQSNNVFQEVNLISIVHTFTKIVKKQDKQCSYNLMMWCIVIMETHQRVPFAFVRYISYWKHCYGNNVLTLVMFINVMSLSTIYTYLDLHLSYLKFVAGFNYLGFSSQILIKVCNIKCHENMSSWSQVDTYGQADGEMDRHDTANRHFAQLCKCV